jgi:hypothetical protein
VRLAQALEILEVDRAWCGCAMLEMTYSVVIQFLGVDAFCNSARRMYY